MAPRRGPWIRPLLDVPQAALRQYLEQRGLSAWQDPANRDPRHLRSWLRSAVLPVLEERLPDVRERLLAVAEQSGRDRRAWNAVPALLEGLDLRVENDRVSVAAAPLRGYRSEVQQAVLAALGRRFGVPLGRQRLARLSGLVGRGRSGSRLRLTRGLEAELAFDRLILGRPEGSPFVPVELATGPPVEAGPHRFRCRRAPADTPATRLGTGAQLSPERYRVRPWRHGDRIRPLGGTGSRAVVVLLREARIAAGRRRSWPVVEAEDATIVWVPGICRSGERVPLPGKDALHVECDLG